MLIDDDMSEDEIQAVRDWLARRYGEEEDMSRNPAKQAAQERDQAVRSARIWRTAAHQNEQGGRDATRLHRAADEAAARAVAAQRVVDRATGGH